MADVPRKINAAQLAARKIKTAGSLRRKGARSDDERQRNIDNSVPLFADPDSVPFFGGGMSSAGTGFNFTASVPQMSFGSPQTSGQESTSDDPRADTTGEEAARRKKPFAMSTEPQNQQGNNSFQAPSSSLFGQTNRGTSPFQMPSFAPSPQSSSFTFGAAPIAQEKPSSSAFTFGQSSQNQTSNATFSFGNTATQYKPPGGTFSFGQSTPTAPSTGFTFGATTVQEKPQANVFSFGQSSPASQQLSSSSAGFGNTAVAEKPASSVFSFGQTQPQAQPSNSSISFGSTPAISQPPATFFGQAAAQKSAPSTGIFQSAGQQQSSGSNIFANSNPQTSNVANIFGGQAKIPEEPLNNIFGSRNQSPSPAPPTNIFGQSQNPTPAPITNMFGTPSQNAASTSSNNLFGAQPDKSASVSSNSLFGTQTQQSAPNINIFGNLSQSSTPSSNLFGSPKPQVDTSNKSALNPISLSNMFGSQLSAEANNNPFGSLSRSASPASTSGSIFGNKEQQSTNSNNIFGSLNRATSQEIISASVPASQPPLFAIPSPTNGFVAHSERDENVSISQSVSFNPTSKFGFNYLGQLSPGEERNYGEVAVARQGVDYFNDFARRPRSISASAQFIDTTSCLDSGGSEQGVAMSGFGSELGDPMDLGADPVGVTLLQLQVEAIAISQEKCHLDPLFCSGPTTDMMDVDRSFVLDFESSQKPRRYVRRRALARRTKLVLSRELQWRLSRVRSVWPFRLYHPAQELRRKFMRSKNLDPIFRRRPRCFLEWFHTKVKWAYANIALKVSSELGMEKQHSAPNGVLSASSPSTQNSTPSAPQPTPFSLFPQIKPVAAPEAASQPPPSGMFPNFSNTGSPSTLKETSASKPSQNPQYFNRTSALGPLPSSDDPVQSIEKLQPYDIPDIQRLAEVDEAVMESRIPKHFNEIQKEQFRGAYRVRALNSNLQNYMKATPIGFDFSESADAYKLIRARLVTDTETKVNALKRKAGIEDDQGQLNGTGSNKRSKLDAGSGLPQQPTAKPPSTPRKSPEKRQVPASSQPSQDSSTKTGHSIEGSTTPKAAATTAPLFTSSTPAAVTSSSSSSPRKRQAEFQITKDNPAEEESAKSGSATSNIFKKIIDSPEKRIFAAPKGSKSESPKKNVFSALPMPASAGAVSGGVFGPSMSSPSALQTVGQPAQAVKPAAPVVSVASTLTPVVAPIKPPTFGTGPVNFLAQFGQQLKKDRVKEERDLMEKAKDEDMDSDEDESEWEARYQKKRDAEVKALEDLSKSKRASFVPGQGFSFGTTKSPSEEVASQKPNTSGASSASQSNVFPPSAVPPVSNSNLFPSVSRSETSSPAGISSNSGSVFDNPPSSITAFSGNIFGHLSDVDSGAESGKGNDADDDNSDEEDDDEESEGGPDEETNDPTYEPPVVTGSTPGTPGTPGTPAEETGAGIASTKKPSNLFSFGTSTNSGTSTPTGSGGLFDRISKDSNGNPIRQLPTDEKEKASTGSIFSFGGSNNTSNPFASLNQTPGKTTKPGEGKSTPPASNIFGGSFGSSNSNPFASLNKTPGEGTESPIDNTWKPDTPIKFGTGTPTPSVNVTAPSPSKTSPFSGLFSNSTTAATPASSTAGPFSGLFGNTASPKAPSLFANLNSDKPASVGFSFGGPSTTSSLFPSAVASTTTSRATSPGGTTDNDSAADGNDDPDAEKHEQIDLISGGAGEEDEEALHTVRAKALKFVAPKKAGDKSEWTTKGLGPLKILKHKETGSSRVLLRADPSGSIVLNKSILSQVSYEATGKTVKLLTADDAGKGLETWILQVKTADMAKELAEFLEANKNK
jgi:hypothetical protein